MAYKSCLIRSLLFNILKNRRTAGKVHVLGIECVFNFSLHSFKKCFTPIGIWRVTFELRIEEHAGFNLKCPRLFTKFVMNWQNLVRHLIVTLHEHLFSGSEVVTCGQTDMAKIIGADVELFVASAL